MAVNDLTGKPLKHYAQDESTKDRYIIIALQNDNDPDKCSVVAYDYLNADMRSELVSAINSDECQRLTEPWTLLDKKTFYAYPNQSMLSVLRAFKQIRSVEQAQVKIALPGEMTMTPKELLDAIHTYEAKKQMNSDRKYHVDVNGNSTPIADEEMDKRVNNMEDRMSSMEAQLASIAESLAKIAGASGNGKKK